MAASAAASAGSTALAGASEVAGGTSALTAAFKAAQANMESASIDTGSNVGDSGSGQHTVSGLEQSAFGQTMGAASSGQQSGYASRVANAGRLAANASSLIAEHVGQDMSSQASAAIAGTAGGRLAAAIDESSKTSHADDNPVFEGNNLSTRSDEISDFVNKNPTQD